VLLGRLAKHLGVDQHLLFTSRKITRIFVTSDVTTFLIQVSAFILELRLKIHSSGRQQVGELVLQLQV
jgi:hypothetical protein